MNNSLNERQRRQRRRSSDVLNIVGIAGGIIGAFSSLVYGAITGISIGVVAKFMFASLGFTSLLLNIAAYLRLRSRGVTRLVSLLLMIGLIMLLLMITFALLRLSGVAHI